MSVEEKRPNTPEDNGTDANTGSPRRHLTSAERHAIYEERARQNDHFKRTRRKKQKIRLSSLIALCAVILICGILALVYVNNTVWIPQKQYNNAMEKYESGLYLKAYDIFIELGDYKDAISMAETCVLKNAQELSGRENVIIGTSKDMPWFSVVPETGEISFIEKNYKGGSEMVIPDVFDGILVRRIAPQTFRYADFMTSVTIPASVTVISERAFLKCTSLTELVLSDNVTVLGESAFSGCEGITSLTLGKGLSEIGQRAFKDCSSITSVVIPEGVSVIDSRAFNGCSSLKELHLPSTLTTVGGYAFTGCKKIEKVSFPGTADELLSIFSAEDGKIITDCPVIEYGG